MDLRMVLQPMAAGICPQANIVTIALDLDPDDYFTQFILPAGTYYLSVEGKQVTYLDGTDEPWLSAASRSG